MMDSFDVEILSHLLLQHFFVDYMLANSESRGGLETMMIEGIPSVAEYLADYCSAAVSITLLLCFM